MDRASERGSVFLRALGCEGAQGWCVELWVKGDRRVVGDTNLGNKKSPPERGFWFWFKRCLEGC